MCEHEPTLTEWATSNAMRELDYAQTQLNHARKYLEQSNLTAAIDAMTRLEDAVNDAKSCVSQGL